MFLLSPETIKENQQTIEEILSGVKGSRKEGMEELIRVLADPQLSDFYTAPASAKYHLPIPGGLAQHSLNVRRLLYRNYKYHFGSDMTKWPDPPETLDITSLLHDAGAKMNCYTLVPVEYITDNQAWKLNKEWKAANQSKLKPEDVKRFVAYCYDEDEQIKKIFKATASSLIDWLCKNPYNNPMPETPEEGPPTYNSVDPMPLGHGEKSLAFLQDFITLTTEEKLAIRWHMGPWDISEYYGKKAFDVAKKVPLVNLLYIADYEASHILDAMEV